MTQHLLGFLGGGNMAEAIIRAAISKGIAAADRVIVADPAAARRDLLAGLGVTVTEDNAAVVAAAEQVVLAVKPQVFPGVADVVKAAADKIVISIMAGLSSAKIESLAGVPLRLVRVMPNTPMMVGAGMSGVALGPHAQEGDDELAMRLFGAAGEAVRVSEFDIDAVTAVSGSGPAYVFYLAEAMQKAAADLGLSAHARTLVNHTILGAAKLLVDSTDDAATLRRKVTSPGGTTQAAITHLEEQAVGRAVVDAVAAAHRRSRELGA